MRFTATSRTRRAALATTIAAVATLSVTGCGYVTKQATTIEYAASDGVNGQVGPLELRNMLVIAEDADQPGRISGAVYNNSNQKVKLTMEGPDGGKAQLTVPAKGEYFIDNDAPPEIIEPAGAKPGALSLVTFETSGASEDLTLPVLDDTFPRYATMMPTEGS
ncbi:MAG TPA: hypothetical protein VFI97_02550 [Arthrobacter sp.]|nr:hypothetical protein [Arthrobacter sp.]